MGYVTGCVIAVPTARKEEFLRHCVACAKVLKANGAIEIVECWGEDVPDGVVTSFPMAVKCEKDETVVFSWILWPSKQVCETGMQALMADESVQPEVVPIPFDGKRMIFGGFEVISEFR